MKKLFAALLTLTLVACADDKKDDYIERSVNDIYNSAMAKFNDHDYEAAATEFGEIERQHPYSDWAVRAELMAAYASYQGMKYTEAINALNSFIELHPGYKDIDYAYYLRALCYYEQVADIKRDQAMTEAAMTSFDDVTRRFPNSTYARDAQLKNDLLLNHMAGKDMEIGRYYEKRGLYAAAVNRFKTVVDQYQTTNQVPEALHRLTEVYLLLGLPDEAKRTAAVLGYNYPNSDWYQQSYALLVKNQVKPDQPHK